MRFKEYLEEAETFDVWAKRNGKYKKLTERPLSKKEADQVAKDIKKANAPSIDSKTIEVKRSNV